MLADFKITLHSDPPHVVQVKVYENLRALRSAATQFENRGRSPKRKQYGEHDGVGGLCHRFHLQRPTKGGGWEKNPLCAIVRLAPPYLGVGIVAHEMAHAAVWIREIQQQFKPDPITCVNDEEFCWILGELVRQTIETMYQKGIY